MSEPDNDVPVQGEVLPPKEDAPVRPDDLIAAVPGLARIAVGVWWRTNEWMLGVTVSVGSRVVRAAVSGESPSLLLQETGAELRGYARRVLGFTGLEERFRGPQPDRFAVRDQRSAEELRSLRDRGAELLRQSTDVHYQEHAHPAYERILGDLAPDEGRILRLLATEGPQPAVDVRKGLVPGAGLAEFVAPNLTQLAAAGLSMIGPQAGARYLDRVPAYLNNLYRLGLVWFSREPLADPLRYQVLEAQPDVLEAIHTAGRAKTVRRSIHLTPFGEDFCRVCLPLDTAELDALPQGSPASLDGGKASAQEPEPATPGA